MASRLQENAALNTLVVNDSIFLKKTGLFLIKMKAKNKFVVLYISGSHLNFTTLNEFLVLTGS